jgi:hypothetical protein
MTKLCDVLDRLETTANWISDMDREWWPFLFLRPARNHPMSNARVAALAALYGVTAGAFANLASLLTAERPSHWYTLPAVMTAIFFALYRSTFALAWNRRAGRTRPAPRVGDAARLRALNRDTDPHIDTD